MAQGAGVFSIFETLGGAFSLAQQGIAQLTSGGGFSAAVTQFQNELVPVAIANPNQLIDLVRREAITQKDFFKFMKKNGIDEPLATILLNNTTQFAGIVENIVLYRRGLLGKTTAQNSQELTERLTTLGVDLSAVGDIVTASETQPSPQDLITFLVREVFTPEIVKKFGQALEFPDAAVAEGFKIGLTEDLLRKYWSAHWELPAVSQVTESMFRFAPDLKDEWKKELNFLGLTEEQLETDFSTVDLLLKTKDVMPFWRPRIRAIAFNTMTRVDVGRMIRLRILNYKEAIYQYRRQGYTPTDAERLVKFRFIVESLPDWLDGIKTGVTTMEIVKKELLEWNITEPHLIKIVETKLKPAIAEGISDYRKLTRSIITKGFKQGQLTRSEAIQMLIDIGHDETQAKFILEVETFQKSVDTKATAKQKDFTKSDVLASFKQGVTTEDVAISRLQELYGTRDEAVELVEIEKAKIRMAGTKK